MISSIFTSFKNGIQPLWSQSQRSWLPIGASLLIVYAVTRETNGTDKMQGVRDTEKAFTTCSSIMVPKNEDSFSRKLKLLEEAHKRQQNILMGHYMNDLLFHYP